MYKLLRDSLDIEEEIERKRKALNQVGMHLGFDLQIEEVLSLSIELDELLNKYQKVL
ncbi:aspartyl-phosphate phosphatase Spo0E family protein [Paenibacillus sp. GCM10027629]|uniref:aspartyl-phosphate phosphatase Spo0E family protein n=1 Tax=Paenibacillus sp. GCM10027629 TaxID=3273414 RepID=UPI003633EA21